MVIDCDDVTLAPAQRTVNMVFQDSRCSRT